ncbi:MAG: hypothetical protein RIB98_19610 [Acidimicrobiales bacterium]
MASTPLVAWMNPLPMELAPALRSRRRSVASRTRGRVLDLGGWADHLDAYRLGAEVESVVMLDRLGDVRAGTGRGDPEGVTRLDTGIDELEAAGEGPFDSIVSLIRLPLVENLDRFLRTVIALMADDGYAYFVEPVRRSGNIGRMLALSGSMRRAAGGLHLDRDLPADIRARGLVITELDRFDVPTLSAPMRPFIDATVRRPTVAAPTDEGF